MNSPRTRNTLGDMHNILMEELERLIDCDEEKLDGEINRANAIATVSQSVIGNAKTIIDATRLQAQTAVAMPRLLVGGDPCQANPS